MTAHPTTPHPQRPTSRPDAGPVLAPAGPATPPPAGAEGGEGPEGGEEATPSTEELIAGCREQIDVLDARILTLIQERRAVSERVQHARLGAGGRRVHLARELEILERYRAELGGAGTRIGMLLLELCRGRG